MGAGRILAAVWLLGMGGCASVEKPVFIRDPSDLARYVGKTVALAGRMSDQPYQHLVAAPETHPHVRYFDVGSEQIVLYMEIPVHATRLIEVEGVVVKIEGSSKRPGAGSASGPRYTEYQVVVDRWE